MSTSDDRVRSNTKFLESADGFAQLSGRNEAELYASLATLSTVRRDADGQLRHAMPVPDDLNRSNAAVELGRAIFRRWSRAFHDFLCLADPDDKDLRDRVLQAIFDKKAGGTAIVAGALVAAFALSPVTAGLVAALVVRLIVAPAADGICEAWTESLRDKAAAKPV